MGKRPWVLYTFITTLLWGIWGAFIEIPEKAGFPATLGYTVWALTMIPCAIVALININFKLEYDAKSIFWGCLVGILGAAGQLILFQALRTGPAYVVFPIISLFPVVTIFMSTLFLKETTTRRHWLGIILALVAILSLSYQEPNDKNVSGYLWLLLSIVVFFMWGIQAFAMKFSNDSMKAESIFFYMMLTAILLIPVALWMTDFSQDINWDFKGPYLAALIQVLNSIGALTLVYALRYGKAIIVVPITALAPVITIIISLLLYMVMPHFVVLTGMVLAVIAIYILAE
ncbi:membrane protein [Adhaeribacter aerolatus]|uniref:Membrane protein n=1 Tax=Adhaeribacter aerolatus TaxID=670289 RepID=A0A512B3E3_9BACT|nr:EamA family transporter [Adhaeribacter aerolatus]GEO06472.1 membrane protein [Adhaeribacter aerolatus]